MAIMTEQERIARALEMTKEAKPDTTARDMAVRTQALDMAIKSQCGLVYGADDGKAQYSEVEIIKAATAFENFIKGIKEVTSNEHRKENW